MMLEARRSGDGRIRTCFYGDGHGNVFCIAEPTRKGTLITELTGDGEVLEQVLSEINDAERALSKHLTGYELSVTEVKEYERVGVNAACDACGSRSIARELDDRVPEGVDNVPVVPIFVCGSCGAKYYQLGDTYLRRMVARKSGLFDKAELAELEENEAAFVDALQENVIRIFASKKIKRLRLGESK